jgi:RNA polymerase sigma-70 factor (ECF subfamily)
MVKTMSTASVEHARRTVDEVYRAESRRVFATLIRLLGDFDLAEEALHEAFAAAVEQWPRDGVPANPRAWLVSAGRFKAVDVIRRRARFDATLAEIGHQLGEAPHSSPSDAEEVEDDRLRLIFTCCHPALAANTQVALTLREVCGLTTEEIASAFLTSPSTIAQRIVRGKAKIREARIPYQVPSLPELPQRLDSVLSVTYLVFNEGYSASSGEQLTRSDLSGEAIRLGHLLRDLLPVPEVLGLLALMLLHAIRSRRASDWSSRRWPRSSLACTPCKRRSPPCMPTQPARPTPIGPRSWRSTTFWPVWRRRQLSSSIEPSRWQCAMAQRPVWNGSRPSSPAAN